MDVIVLGTPVRSRCRHLIGRDEEQTALMVVGQRHPAHIFLVAHLLRQHEFVHLLGDGAAPQSFERRLLAVGIAVPRTTTEPRHIFIARRHFKPIAQTRQNHVFATRRDDRIDGNRTVGHHKKARSRREGHRIAGGIDIRDFEVHRAVVGGLFDHPFARRNRQRAQSEVVPRFGFAVIVVGRQAESVEPQRIRNHRRAVALVSRKRSLREIGHEICSANRQRLTRLAHFQLAFGRGGSVWIFRLDIEELNLLRGYFCVGSGPKRRLLQTNLETNETFLFLGGKTLRNLGNGRCEVDFHTVACLDVHIAENTRFFHDSIAQNLPFQVMVVGRTLRQLAFQHEMARLTAFFAEINRLVDFLHIHRLRREGQIGEDNAVAAEIAVVGFVAEIAAVGPVSLRRRARNGNFQALVFPVPDKFADEGGIFLVEVEHFALRTHRIAHRVGVFALHVRLHLFSTFVIIQSCFADVLHLAVGAVHRARHIAPLAVALVVGRTGLVEFLDGFHHTAEIVARTAFIASRPNDDAGVVAQEFHHSLVALDHRFAEQCHRRQSPVAVTFHIGLRQHVKAVLVAKFIEKRVVRIVRRAHGVDVQLFHQPNVGLGFFARHRSTAHFTEIVAVHAANNHRFSIDEQRAVVAQRDGSETCLLTPHINDFVALFQHQFKVVESRIFSTPQFHVGHVQRHRFQVIDVRRVFQHQALSVENPHDHLSVGQRHARQGHIELHTGIFLSILQACRADKKVFDATFRRSPENHIAHDARQSPIVLTFEERTAREAINLHRHDVVAADIHEIGHVELRRQIRIFGIAHKLTVHPDVIAVSGTVETQENILAVPIRRHGEMPPIATDGILHRIVVGPVVGTTRHHTVIAVVGEGKELVHVERLVPVFIVANAINLPRRRHVDVGPSGVVVIDSEKVGRTARRVFHPPEFPRSVQTLLLVGHQERMRLFAVHARRSHVVPLVHRLRKNALRNE